MEIEIDERELFRALARYENDQRKIEYLETVLKKNISLEVRRLALQLRGDLHKKMKWFVSSARDYSEVAEIAKTFNEKINFYLLAAEMFIKGNDYFSADDFYRKAAVLEKETEKDKVKLKMMNMYLAQGEYFEKINRIRNAINTYSKVLTYKPGLEEANKVRDKIAFLYERMGNVREANNIRAIKEAAIKAQEERQKQQEKQEPEMPQEAKPIEEFSEV